MSKKYLYYFSEGSQAFGGDKTAMRNILGGKGSGLAEMTAAGMPVPQGFTITTEACTQYYADGRQINAEIQADIFAHVRGLEELTGKKLGDVENPLLVSVRSGARQSMPGMMDTILNLGLNDASVEGLAKKTGNPRFAYDSYRRFVQMFADVVMGVSKSLFEEEIDKMKAAKGVTNDVDLDADDLKQLVVIFKKIYEDNEHKPFPQDPNEQLIEAVKAVFRSWDNPRANVYRKMNEIPYEWGTAVNVQQMAFGNSGDRSGTGVAFTRDPATGAKKLMGEYLINAQGEDVVAGVRTPSPISHLQDQMPEVYDEFVAIANRLEHYFKDMQDMEFTIEDGKLYILTEGGLKFKGIWWNGAISAAVYDGYTGMDSLAGLQMTGTAVYIDPLSDEYRSVIEARGVQLQQLQQMPAMLHAVRLDITRYELLDGALRADGYAARQVLDLG